MPLPVTRAFLRATCTDIIRVLESTRYDRRQT